MQVKNRRYRWKRPRDRWPGTPLYSDRATEPQLE